jgi:diamine N-acetyltransferase
MPDPASSSRVVTLEPVDADNWRDVARLDVTSDQQGFVATPTYYLCLCHYGSAGWQPLAVRVANDSADAIGNDTANDIGNDTGHDTRRGEIVGFLMWTVDPADGSCWLGGVTIDRRHQGRGIGAETMRTVLDLLSARHGHHDFALSYQPTNTAARRMYARLGFAETGETEDDGAELVARCSWSGRPTEPSG